MASDKTANARAIEAERLETLKSDVMAGRLPASALDEATAATPAAPGGVVNALMAFADEYAAAERAIECATDNSTSADERATLESALNAALSSPAPVAAPALTLKGEVWDDNPDGIVPGQDRGPRMNPDTGFYED